MSDAAKLAKIITLKAKIASLSAVMEAYIKQNFHPLKVEARKAELQHLQEQLDSLEERINAISEPQTKIKKSNKKKNEL